MRIWRLILFVAVAIISSIDIASSQDRVAVIVDATGLYSSANRYNRVKELCSEAQINCSIIDTGSDIKLLFQNIEEMKHEGWSPSLIIFDSVLSSIISNSQKEYFLEQVSRGTPLIFIKDAGVFRTIGQMDDANDARKVIEVIKKGPSVLQCNKDSCDCGDNTCDSNCCFLIE
ncbi:hypothetical protein [Aquibium oceanicum]|uniref:hypothetical protein n=1 Tax=Aquibium oceanicum TaxID=1670800 RepID=UPI0012FF5D39|nr:hypothetical protein [Aquibium oceanicum]